jgi:hypothetical protein
VELAEGVFNWLLNSPNLLLTFPALPQESVFELGSGQYHHAVAGGVIDEQAQFQLILNPDS